MRKILAFLVALIVILTAIPFTASAANSNLPESTPLILKEAVESGRITGAKNIRSIKIAAAIYDALINFKEVVDLRPFNLAYNNSEFRILNNCLNYVLSLPEMFQVVELFDFDNSGFTVATLYEVEYFAEFHIAYLPNVIDANQNEYFDKEKALEKHAEFDSLVESFVSKIPTGLSKLETMLYAYDRMAVDYQYQITGDYWIYDAYGFFKDGHGVCDGYTKAFLAIMERLGIPSMRVMSDEGNHSWNIVCLDGEYYHVDTTWSDPKPDKNGQVYHEYFLKSDAALTSVDTESHIDWYAYESNMFGLKDISCSSTKYDSGYLWGNTSNAFCYYNGEHYFIEDASEYEYKTLPSGKEVLVGYSIGAVIRKTRDFINYSDVKSVKSDPWLDKNGSGQFIFDYNSGFYMVGTQIYYNDYTRLKYFDVATGNDGVLFEVKDSNIAGFSYKGEGKFEYTEFYTQNGAGIYGKKIHTLTDMGKVNNSDNNSFADDLASIRKYISGRSDANMCLLKGDVSENDGKVDMRDLVALKKLALQ